MKRGPKLSSPISLEQVLIWADEYKRRTGKYPSKYPEPVGQGALTWLQIDGALRLGLRGLPSGTSLARLLHEHRGTRLPQRLTEEQILGWVDAFASAHGRWPNVLDGSVPDSGGETWTGINAALRNGGRGLQGGQSLGLLIATQRGVRTRAAVPRLTIDQILRMADLYLGATGRWPKCTDGAIPGFPGETWKAVDSALRHGARGLPGGSSLAELLCARRGTRNRRNLPSLTEAAILAWALAHEKRTGQRPRQKSGAVVDAPGETWSALDMALRQGHRGLPGGSSLARLLGQGLRQHHACGTRRRPRVVKAPDHAKG